MRLVDWVIIGGAAAIGYGAVSFFLGRKPAQTRQPLEPSPPPAAPVTPLDDAKPVERGRSAWEQMQDRPAPQARKDPDPN